MRFDSKIFQRFISGLASDEEFEQVERYLSEQPDIALAEVDTCEDTLVSVLREGYENGQAPVDFENGELNDPSWEIVAQNLNRQFTLATRQLDISQYVDPPQSDEEVGRIGNYRLLKQIGSGGMGIVFEAKPVDSDQAVAIKLMNPLLAANPEAAYRFRRESLAAAKLTHDKIVKISEVDQASSIPFLVMELLRGESLAQRLRRDGRLSADRIIDYSIQVSEALEYAHARGILHRDIKPDNIWIDEYGRVKLLDFGLARTIDDQTGLTQTGAILGTPKYMSPEQAKGRNVDHRSDLFSLGSVMYEMLIGRPAFDRENFYSTILAVANDEVTDFESKRLETNTGLHRIVTQLLHKAPEKRIGTATALKKELESVDPCEMLEPQAHVGRGEGNNWKSVLLGFAAAALLFCFSIIIYVQTDRGTLVIDAGDDVEVSVVNETVKIRELGSDKEYTLKVGENRLPSGAYEIVVTDPASGLELSTTHFSLKRGGKELVNVGLKESKTGVAASDGDGGSLRGNPNAIGISPNAPARSITEVLSPAKVGEELSIKNDAPPGDFSIISKPISLPGISTWSIEGANPFSSDSISCRDMSFSHDGQRIAVADYFGVVRIWKYGNSRRELEHIIPHPGAVEKLAWSPVENVLMVACEKNDQGSVILWRVDKSVTAIDQVGMVADELAWSPSGATVALQTGLGEMAQIHLFNVGEGTFVGIPNQGITGEISQRPWSFDERYFAFTHRSDNGYQIEIKDLHTNKVFHRFKNCQNAAWSTKSLLLALTNRGPVLSQGPSKTEFWDVSSLTRVAVYERQENEVVLNWRSTDNKFAVKENGRSEFRAPEKIGKIKTIDFENVRKLSDGTFRFDQIIDTKLVGRAETVVGPNDRWACQNDGVFNDQSIQAVPDPGWQSSPSIPAVNVSKRLLATGQYKIKENGKSNHRIAIHDLESGQLKTTIKLDGWNEDRTHQLENIKLSKSGNLLLCSFDSYINDPSGTSQRRRDRENILYVFDLQTNQKIFEYSGTFDDFSSAQLSPNEKYVAIPEGPTVKVVELASQSVWRTFEYEYEQNNRNRNLRIENATMLGCYDDEIFWWVQVDREPIVARSNLDQNKTEVVLKASEMGITNFDELKLREFKWNNPTKRLCVGLGSDRFSSQYSAHVYSFDGDDAEKIFSITMDRSTGEKIADVALSESGENLLYTTFIDNNRRAVTQYGAFVVDLDGQNDQPAISINVDRVMTIFPAYSGFWLIGSRAFENITFANSKQSIKLDRQFFPYAIQSVGRESAVIEWNTIKYFDQNGVKTRTVVLQSDQVNSNDSWFGNVGSSRFGSSVKQAPATYLVTILDDPKIGIVTEPLDEVRSKYPQLFSETGDGNESSISENDTNGNDAANTVGIDRSAPIMSIADAFSKKRVAEKLAIIPGEGFNRQALMPSARPLGEVKNWAIETEAHRQSVTQLDFNFDGSLLASAGSDDVVRIWEYVGKTRKLKHIIPMTGRIRMLRWSPVENAIITVVREHVSTFDSGEELVCLWRVGESVTLLDQLKQHVNQVAWSPSGTKVAMEKGDRGSNQIGLFNVSSGKFHGIPNGGMTGEFTERPWSHDEKLFAVATIESVGESQSKATLKIWDLESKVLYHQIPGVHKGVWAGHKRVLGYAYFSQSRAPNRFFEFLDFETMRTQAKCKFVNDRVVVGSATNNYLGLQIVDDQKSGPDSDPGKTICIVDCSEVGTGEIRFEDLPHVKATSQWGDSDSLAISVDGKYALSRGMSISDSYEDENRELHRSIKWENLIRVCGTTGRVAVPYCVADADDNQFFELRVYEYGTGELLVSEKTPMFKNASLSSFEDIKFSNDGKKIAFLTRARPAGNESIETQSCKIIDLANGDILKNIEQESVQTDTVHWSPDDKHLVFDDSNAVRIVNVASGDVVNSIELERVVAGGRSTGFSAQTTVFGVTNNSVYLHCHNDRIVVAPFDSDQTTTLLNNQTKLTFQDKTFSINEFETAAWNSATDSLAVAAEIVVREAKDESEKGTRHVVLVLKQSGNTATIDKLLFLWPPQRDFALNEKCFELKYSNSGKYLVAINGPNANRRSFRTNGDNYVRSINLESDETSFTRVTPVFKDVAPPEMIVRDDTIAYNFQGQTHFRQLSKGIAETFSEQFEIHQMAFVQGNCVATDGTRVCVYVRPEKMVPNAIIPSGYVSYLLDNSKPENNDLKDVFFGAAEIINLPEDSDLNGMCFVELSADGTEFCTTPLSEAIQRFPQLVNDAIEPGFIEKVFGGSTKATKPLSGGINLDYPRRSVSEVLSPDTVGKELAIEPGKAIGNVPRFVDPIKLPDAEAWAIEAELEVQRVYEMCFNHDGSLLAAGGGDGMVRVWEYKDQTRKLKHIIPHNGTVKKITWSPVQNVLMVACKKEEKGSVVLWNVSDQLTIIDQTPIAAEQIAWAPSGTKVAIQADRIHFFDVSQGRFAGLPNQDIRGEITKRPWSFDEKYFCVSNSSEVAVTETNQRPTTKTAWETSVYDLVEKRLHHTFKDSKDAAWGDDGLTLAIGKLNPGSRAANLYEFWDMAKTERNAAYRLQSNETIVDWNSNSNTFAVAKRNHLDEKNEPLPGVIKIVDLQNINQAQSTPLFEEIETKHYGGVLSTVGPKGQWACNGLGVLNDHLNQQFPGIFWANRTEFRGGSSIVFDKAGRRVAALQLRGFYKHEKDKMRVVVHDATTGEMLFTSQVAADPNYREMNTAIIKMSPSGKHLMLIQYWLSQGEDVPRAGCHVSVFDIDKKETVLSRFEPGFSSDQFHFNTDETQILAAGWTNVAVIDIATNEVTHQLSRPRSEKRRLPDIQSSLVYSDDRCLLWYYFDGGDSEIVELDLNSGEAKTILKFDQVSDLVPHSLGIAKLSASFWNPKDKRLSLMLDGVGILNEIQGERLTRRYEPGSAVYIFSLIEDKPKLEFMRVIDNSNRTGKCEFSTSGDLLYVRTFEKKSASNRDLIAKDSFLDWSKHLKDPVMFHKTVAPADLVFAFETGFCFLERGTPQFVVITKQSGESITINDTGPIYTMGKVDGGFAIHSDDSVLFCDEQGNRTSTVVMKTEFGNPDKRWHGRVGAHRFGPWVENAPHTYLVTISDDPDVGVVTVPLDEARSKYPELFWEK